MKAEEGSPTDAAEPSGADRPALTGACLSARDAAIALLVFAAALGLYAATAQARVYGHDGAFLINAFALDAEGHSNSALYASAAEVARSLLASDDPMAPLLALSHVCGALGAAAAYAIARALGAPRRGAVFGAALFAAAPAQWFYATAIETHALHVAAVGVGALACLLGPWKMPWVARGIAALGVLILYPTHMSGVLLLPGWLLLARAARARRAQPLPPVSDLAGTGAVLAVAAVLSACLANSLLGAGFTPFSGEEAPTRFLDQFTERFTLDELWSGWALAFFLLPATAIWTVGAGALRGPARPALLALVLIPLAVALWLSIPERGAYLLGSAPFLAALCAFAPLPTGARGWAVALGLVLLQGVAGRGELARFDSVFPAAERGEAVRAAIGPAGFVMTLDPNTPRTAAFVPGVHDYDLSAPLADHAARSAAPEEFAAFVLAAIEQVFPASPVALDLTYRRLYEPPPEPELVARLEPYLLALEEALRARFKTRLAPHPWWPLLVLVP